MQIRTKARQLDRGLIPARTRPSRSPSATPIRSPGAFGHFLDLQRAYGNRLVGQMIQAKLAVSQPGDPYEREADRVADQVLRMPATAVQRKCAACEEEEQHIQRSTEPAATASPQNVAESFVNGLGPGHPLDVGVRAYFEPRFGADFGGVRVHIDARAAEAARAVNARAFTVGRDVVFAEEQYRPQQFEGRRLLAHELTHVLQQTSGKPYCAAANRPSQISVQGESRGLAASPPPLLQEMSQKPSIQRRVQILDDPLPPGMFGPPARAGADFIKSALEELTDLNLQFKGNFLSVDAATRAGVLQERRERPTAADVRAKLFVIPGVSREKASAALKLAQIVVDTRATAVIQPVFGEAPVIFGAFPAAGGGGTQRIDIEDIRAWSTLTSPAMEAVLQIIKGFLRGLLGLAAATRPAKLLRTDTAGTLIYHEIVESFQAALAGPGTAFPLPHGAAIDTVNVALRSMGSLEFLDCPSPVAPSAGGQVRVRVFWKRRRGVGHEDRFEQPLFLSAPPEQVLVWVDPPVLIQNNVATGSPCPP